MYSHNPITALRSFMRRCRVILWGLVFHLTVWWLTQRADCIRLCNEDGLSRTKEQDVTKLEERNAPLYLVHGAKSTNSAASMMANEDNSASVTHVSHTFKPPPGPKITTPREKSGHEKVMPLSSSEFPSTYSHSHIVGTGSGKHFGRPPAAMSGIAGRPAETRVFPKNDLNLKGQPRGQQHQVAISDILLTRLVKGSLVPPSGPSRDHNLENSGTLPSSDIRANARAIFFRIERIDAPRDEEGVIDLPAPQKIGDSMTYRIFM